MTNARMPASVEPIVTLRSRSLSTRLRETWREFWFLGITSFGGPGVHVVILRKRFVQELRWVSPALFADLLSLGSALPGPGSTQLAMSIALVRNGTLAGLLAFFCWSLPASIGMTALAAAVHNLPAVLPERILSTVTGVNSAAVGLIALAAHQLAVNSISDGVSRFVLLASAALSLLHNASWVYPTVVFGGGIITLAHDSIKTAILRRRSGETVPLLEQGVASGSSTPPSPSTPEEEVSPEEEEDLMTLSKRPAIILFIVFALSVIAVALVRALDTLPGRISETFTSLFVAGTVIFGGGPVVIPLLRGYIVETGLVSSRDFLLGFAVLQGAPGPNFSYACFLGALSLSNAGGSLVLGAVIGFFAIFWPGVALKIAFLPAYKQTKKNPVVKSALRGLAAAASGLVLAAVWQIAEVGHLYGKHHSTGAGPLFVNPLWAVVAAFAFTLTRDWHSPPWATIGLGALAGLLNYEILHRI